MKKSVLYSLMASVSMFSIGAHAEDASPSALTTKGYVDTGLKYVYDSIKGDVTNVQGDITNLQTALSDGNGGLIDVGDLKDSVGTAGVGNTPGTGLIGDVEALQDTVGDSNSGLVKDVADNTSDISALETTVGDNTGGLVKDVADLKTAVGDNTAGLVKRVNDLESSSIVYTAGDGIKVTPGATSSDPSTIELNINNAQNNTTYVYKTDNSGNGTWQAMEVEDSWNPEFLTTPANP